MLASVKQVLSGDTVVVGSGGKGATLTLTLSGLKAPRFPQQPSSVAAKVDEPFGLESREFLRQLVMGQKVCFVIDHKDSSDRAWVTLWLGAGGPGALEESVNAKVVKAGWARVKEGSGDLFEVLRKLQPAAGAGVFQPANLAKRLHWDFPGEFAMYADRLVEQRTARALVEYCRDACTFRVQLLDSSVMVWFSLAGVSAARLQSTSPDELALEGKRFSEVRLLHREIVLDVGGSDPHSKTVLGKIIHPIGKCITQELVKAGLAKVADWSLASLPVPSAPGRGETDAPLLRALQRQAQHEHKGVWKDFVSSAPATAIATTTPTVFDGVLSEVLSGDTFLVRLANKGEERRVSLSSVLAPKLAPRNRDDSTDERLAQESREYVRKNFMGRKVTVSVDYVREGKSGLPPRTFVTVHLAQPQTAVNVALEAVRQGWCHVVSHRQDDEERSPVYDDLVQAQNQAKLAKRGLFAAAAPSPITRLSFGGDAARSRAHLPHLTRQADHRCVVEWVASATRMGLDLAEENVLLTSFGLNGIVAPLPRGKTRAEDEPFSREALEFCRSQVFSQGLRVRVESVDRTGGFLGSLLVRGEFNLAFLLLERGLARVHPYSAESTTYKRELYLREQRAQDAKLGIWSVVEVEVVAEEDGEEDEDGDGELEYRECRVSEVVAGDHVFVQFASGGGGGDGDLIRSELSKLPTTLAAEGFASIKRGQLVAGKVEGDDQWHRARVLQLSPPHSCRVVLVDVGSRQYVVRDPSQLTVLPSAIQNLPALAQERRLAFVRCRAAGGEYASEASEYVREAAREGQLWACDTKHGLLLRRDSGELVNEQLVGNGLAFCRPATRPLSDELADALGHIARAQAQARDRHRAMWSFGDPGDEDDEIK